MNDREILVELLREDIEYRRTTQWDIFSWCSTLLIAIVGGLSALRAPHYSLHPGVKAIITVAVAILATFSFIWLTHHQKKEKVARDRLCQEINDPSWKLTNPFHGHRIAVVVLGAAALMAIWLPF